MSDKPPVVREQNGPTPWANTLYPDFGNELVKRWNAYAELRSRPTWEDWDMLRKMHKDALEQRNAYKLNSEMMLDYAAKLAASEAALRCEQASLEAACNEIGDFRAKLAASEAELKRTLEQNNAALRELRVSLAASEEELEGLRAWRRWWIRTVLK